MPRRILLTGFRPFGPHASNPSELVVRRIEASPPEGLRLTTAVLPVDYVGAFGAIRDELDRGTCDAALLLGLAAYRKVPGFERFALNWRGGPIADDSGRLVEGEQIEPQGPAAYLSTLPVDTLVAAVRAVGVPCEASSHAGTFLCNQVLFQTLRHADVRGHRTRAVFLHLPAPADAGSATRPAGDAERVTLDDLERGVRAALAAIARLRPARSALPRPRARPRRTGSPRPR
jgi:pyroglutamyl-peptidase